MSQHRQIRGRVGRERRGGEARGGLIPIAYEFKEENKEQINDLSNTKLAACSQVLSPSQQGLQVGFV